MLAPILAVAVSFFNASSPNCGYVDVLVPTNPIPYASRFTGEVFGENEHVPRVEDMAFLYQLAFERYVVKLNGIEAKPYLGLPLDVEPRRIVGRSDMVFYGYGASDVSLGGPADFNFPPYTTPADMIGYAMNDTPTYGFFAVDPYAFPEDAVPLYPVKLPPDYSGDGVDYVQELVAQAACFTPSDYSVLTNTLDGLLYKKNDLLSLCEIGDRVTTYCWAGGGSTINSSEEKSDYSMEYSYWTKGDPPTGGWKSTNDTHTVTSTNQNGYMRIIADSRKETVAYWDYNLVDGQTTAKVGDGPNNWHKLTEETPSPITLVLCGDKSYFWDYQGEGTSSRSRQKKLHAYAVFECGGWASGYTSVHEMYDTELVNEEYEDYYLVCDLGEGSPTPIPRTQVSGGQTNRYCEIRYEFQAPSMKSLLNQFCTTTCGWPSYPKADFPEQPASPSMVPTGENFYTAEAYLQYTARLDLVDFFGFVEYDFVATVKQDDAGGAGGGESSQEGANDNP